MKLNLKVQRPFADKFNPNVHYEAGNCLPMQADTPEHVARINDLIARSLCTVASVEAEPEVPVSAPKEKDSEPEPPVVAFGEQQYPLAAMKVALEAIGVTVSKNAGAPAVNKALEALTGEQSAALQEVLSAKDE